MIFLYHIFREDSEVLDTENIFGAVLSYRYSTAKSIPY